MKMRRKTLEERHGAVKCKRKGLMPRMIKGMTDVMNDEEQALWSRMRTLRLEQNEDSKKKVKHENCDFSPLTPDRSTTARINDASIRSWINKRRKVPTAKPRNSCGCYTTYRRGREIAKVLSVKVADLHGSPWMPAKSSFYPSYRTFNISYGGTRPVLNWILKNKKSFFGSVYLTSLLD